MRFTHRRASSVAFGAYGGDRQPKHKANVLQDPGGMPERHASLEKDARNT